jgi:hypothetical protein
MPFKMILLDSVSFFWENLRQIATLCLPFIIAGALLNNLILGHVDQSTDTEKVMLLFLVLNFALYPIYTVALILMMAHRARREMPTNTQIISEALGLYFPFLLLFLIGMGLVWCGLVLFVIPGVFLGVRLVFAEFFLVVDRVDPREALLRSFRATRGHFFLILTALGLFVLPIILLAVALAQLLSAVQAGALLTISADATISFIALFIHVILFRIFMQVTRETHIAPAEPTA